MNFRKFKNYNYSDDSLIVNFFNELIAKADINLDKSHANDKRILEYVDNLEEDGKEGIIDRYAWTEPFGYFANKVLFQTIPSVIIITIAFFILFIPSIILGYLGEILKYFFIWTPFYNLFVFFYGSIIYYLIIFFNYIFIFVNNLGVVSKDKEEIKILYVRSEKFAGYSIWYLFYKK